MGKEVQHSQTSKATGTDQQGKGAKTIDDRRPEMASQLSMLDMIRNSPVQKKAWESRASMQSPARPVLQRAGEPSAPDTPEPENTDEAEASSEASTATGEDTRTKEQKQAAVDAAKEEVEELKGKVKNAAEMEMYFPMIQEKYQLKFIGYENFGKSGARIVVRINPEAFVDGSGLLSASPKDANARFKTNVTFTTGRSDDVGEDWATEMEADPVGPEHHQGSGPKGSALKKIMLPLPTNRKKHPGDSNHYIKGHLLNDNLGGPGTDENLFPITEEANKAHHHDVEKKLKEWVNDDGNYIYYNVIVEVDDEHINPKKKDSAANYVDSKFHILAYRLDIDGNRAKSAVIKKTIHSVYEGAAASVTDDSDVEYPDGQEADSGKGATKRRSFNPADVELSTTKLKGGIGFKEIPAWFTAKVKSGIEFLEDFGFRQNSEKERILKDLLSEKANLVSSGLALNWIFDKVLYNKESAYSNVGEPKIPWNITIRNIEAQQSDIDDVISQIENIVADIVELTDAQREWIGKLPEFNFKIKKIRELKVYMTEENILADSIDPLLYKKGMEWARKSEALSDSPMESHEVFKEGYDDYDKAVEELGKNTTLNEKEGHKKAVKDYKDALALIREGQEYEETYAGVTADEGYTELLNELEEKDIEGASVAAKQARKDYKEGLEKYNKNKEEVDEIIGQAKAKTHFNLAMAALSTGTELPKSPAAKHAKEDYEKGLNKVSEGSPIEATRAQEKAKEDYETAIGNKISGGAIANPECLAAKKAVSDYTEIKDGLTLGAYDFDGDLIADRLIKALYDTGLQCAKDGTDPGANVFSMMAKNQYDTCLASVRNGNDPDETIAGTAAFNEYLRGVDEAHRGIRAGTSIAHQAAINDYLRGYADGQAQNKNAHLYDHNGGYAQGYDDGLPKLRRKVSRKIGEAYEDGDEDSELPDDKRRRKGAHPSD